MEALPLVASFLIACAVVPAAAGGLAREGVVRENYRGERVAFPLGAALVSAGLLALIPVSLVAEVGGVDVFAPGTGEAVVYVLGVALLGLLDDLLGSPPADRRRETPRGWRGHARATARGRLSTGALKAAGSLGLALYVLSGAGLDLADYLLGVAVLVLATNFFNLLDLRPGRSGKALVILGVALLLGTRELDPLWALGLFLGPVLAALPQDLGERGMLGDTGSNAIGGIAGLWLVFVLSTTGLAIALALLAAATAYGEFRSISTLIDRTPGLRELDALGRVRRRRAGSYTRPPEPNA